MSKWFVTLRTSVLMGLFLASGSFQIHAQQDVKILNSYEKKIDLKDYPEIIRFVGKNESPFGRINPAAPIETLQYGKLVGVWEALDTAFVDGKKVCCWRGVWAFKYTADGFGIHDYYVQKKEDFPPPPRKLQRNNNLVVLRVYSPKDKMWNIAQISNGGKESGASNFRTFTAIEKSGEVIMSPPIIKGQPIIRAVFFDITKNTYKWRMDLSKDDGKNWTTIFLINAKRLVLSK